MLSLRIVATLTRDGLIVSRLVPLLGRRFVSPWTLEASVCAAYDRLQISSHLSAQIAANRNIAYRTIGPCV